VHGVRVTQQILLQYGRDRTARESVGGNAMAAALGLATEYATPARGDSRLLSGAEMWTEGRTWKARRWIEAARGLHGNEHESPAPVLNVEATMPTQHDSRDRASQ